MLPPPSRPVPARGQSKPLYDSLLLRAMERAHDQLRHLMAFAQPCIPPKNLLSDEQMVDMWLMTISNPLLLHIMQQVKTPQELSDWNSVMKEKAKLLGLIDLNFKSILDGIDREEMLEAGGMSDYGLS